MLRVPSHSRSRAAALVVVAATATSAWLFVHFSPSYARWRNPNSRPELRELVAAAGHRRFVEGRLTGGFAWGPPPSATRGADTDHFSTPADLRMAGLKIEQTAQLQRTSVTLAALGTALLANEQIQPAVDALEEAVGLDPSLGFAWSDLAVAYLARRASIGLAADVPRALDAAERALSLPAPPPEALFNRALALERLGLTERALTAWQAASTPEPSSSEWRAESKSHQDALAEKRGALAAGDGDLQPVRERLFDDVLARWGSAASADEQVQASVLTEARALVDRLAFAPADRLAADAVAAVERETVETGRRSTAPPIPGADRIALRRGHAAYGRARELYKADRMDLAAGAFDDAVRDLEDGGSALALSARMYRAFVAYRQRDVVRAELQLVALIPLARQASYESLVGRATWTLGVLATQRGAYDEAAAQYQVALPAFAKSRELANDAFVHLLLADNHDNRGEPEQGWDDRLLALAGSRREGTLLTSAQSATRLGWLQTAAVLQDEAAALAQSHQRLTNVVDALRSRAQTHMLLGQPDGALRAIAAARQILAAQHDSTWDRLRAEVDLADAQVMTAPTAAPATPAATAAAIDAASRALDYFASANATRRVPEALIARAQLRRLSGDAGAARADLEKSIELLIGHRNLLAPGAERFAFTETARRAGDEIIALEVSAGHLEQALVAADRLRSWDLDGAAPDAAPFDLVAFRAAMPLDTAVVYYAIGDRESFAWIVQRARVGLRRLALTRPELQRLVDAIRSDRLEALPMRRVYELTVLPVADEFGSAARVIVVPDGPLHGVAFGALPGRRARFLAEEIVLSQAPSLSALVATSRRLDRGAGPVRSIAAIGNPRVDRALGSSLPDLPSAAAEARTIAASYPESHVLVGADATSDALVALLPSVDVLHFAGHAIVNDLSPEASYLGIFDQAGRPVYATALRLLPFRHLRLAVLAACQSAGNRTAHRQGPMSLARVLLQAGVPAVLANRWLVDDRAAMTLAAVFHEAYSRSPDAAAALQRAQLAMIRAEDPQLRNPSAWAGWTLIGGNIRPVPPITDRSRTQTLDKDKETHLDPHALDSWHGLHRAAKRLLRRAAGSHDGSSGDPEHSHEVPQSQ
jgi:CHAT domain-containing protein